MTPQREDLESCMNLENLDKSIVAGCRVPVRVFKTWKRAFSTKAVNVACGRRSEVTTHPHRKELRSTPCGFSSGKHRTRIWKLKGFICHRVFMSAFVARSQDFTVCCKSNEYLQLQCLHVRAFYSPNFRMFVANCGVEV